MSQAQRQAVAQETIRWLGTPYHHHGRVMGAGVDCAMLLAEVFQACGRIARVDPGTYATDWHLNQDAEVFVDWVLRLGGVEIAAPGLGDVGLFRFGRTYSHGGIVVRAGRVPMIVHAHIDAGGVVRCAMDETPLRRRAVRWFTMFQES